MPKCEKHPTVEKTIGLCHRCDGEGFTQSDIDDMDDPLLFHNDGNCYACRGTGKGFLECRVCEDEHREKEEMEIEADMMREAGLEPLPKRNIT